MSTQALPLLEESVQQWSQLQYRPLHGWMTSWWSEALLLGGQIDQAQKVAQQAIALNRNIQMWYGVGIAQRVLGRIAQVTDCLVEAECHPQDALATFSSIQSQYELARTHLDLASLAHIQSNHDTATTHLSTAYAWFKKLQVPKWVEKTEQLSREYDVMLTEVELEELTEGEA